MRATRLLAVAVALAAATPAAAQVTLTFNDGMQGAVIGSFYSGLGVTFGNARWDSFVSPGEDVVGAGGLKFIAATGDYQPRASNPILAVFSTPLTAASVRGLNVGANGARLAAYDAETGGNLVAFAEAFGVDMGTSNHPLLSVTGVGIRRLEFYQPASALTEGLLFDNLTFTAAATNVVPEPGTVTLVGVGAVLLAGWGGRRRGARA